MSLADTLKGLFGGGSANATPSITVDELARRLDDDAKLRLIDVRTPGEFASVHATRAESAPLGELGGLIASLGLPTDQPVYVICQSGGRSMRACGMLRAQGYDAVNVSGGTGAWVRSGLPTG